MCYRMWRYALNMAPCILVVLFLTSLIGAGGLFHDEAYYWIWARHLDWGYLDQPPMVAYVVYLTVALAGHSEFAVRVGAVLLFMGTLSLMFILGTSFFGIRTGFCAATILAVVPGFVGAATFISPDVIFLFFWMLSMLVTHRARHHSSTWYAAGLCWGLALLSKYTAVLLFPATFGFLVLSRTARVWLRRPHPYLAVLIAFLVFSPVVAWNARHDWLSFIYQLNHGRGIGNTQSFIEYIISQGMLLSPFILIGGLLALVYGSVRGLMRNEDNLLFLACYTWPPLVLFTLRKGKIHWPLPAYLSMILLLAWLIARISQRLAHTRWRYVWTGASLVGLWVLPLGISFFFLANIFPQRIYTAPVAEWTHTRVASDPRWEAWVRPLVQRSMTYHGWRQLTSIVQERARQVKSGPPYYVLTPTYGIASQIDFYSTEPLISYGLYWSVDYEGKWKVRWGLPDGVTPFNEWRDTRAMIGHDVLFLQQSPTPDLLPTLNCACASVVRLEPITVYEVWYPPKHFVLLHCHHLQKIPMLADQLP